MDQSTRKVIKDWQRTYDPALAVEAGDRVEVTHEDHEWHGWWWCVDRTGQGGWLPTDLIDPARPGPARAMRAMNTRELTVRAGDDVTVQHSERGWTLCEAADGDVGWVPDACLTTVAE